MSIGSDFSVFLLAVETMVNGHTFTSVPQPHVYLGDRSDIPGAGPAVILWHDNQTQPEKVSNQTISIEDLMLNILCCMPLDATNETEQRQVAIDVSAFATEMRNLIRNNRKLGGVIEMKRQKTTWAVVKLDGPASTAAPMGVQKYQAVCFTVSGRDIGMPS